MLIIKYYKNYILYYNRVNLFTCYAIYIYILKKEGGFFTL